VTEPTREQYASAGLQCQLHGQAIKTSLTVTTVTGGFAGLLLTARCVPVAGLLTGCVRPSRRWPWQGWPHPGRTSRSVGQSKRMKLFESVGV